MDDIIAFMNMIVDQINASRNTMDSFFDRAVLWLIVAYFKIKIEALTFAAGIATAIIANVGLSNAISSAWGSIDSQIVLVLNYCRVPDALNIILSAYVTRFILNLMPF